MSYKIVNKGNGDGTYTLSYGKGAGKLTAQMSNAGGWKLYDDEGNKHVCVGPRDLFKTMKSAKEAWGKWAESRYQTGVGNSEPDEQKPEPESIAGPPRLTSPPPLAGPPTIGPPALAPVADPISTSNTRCDPFDAAFHYPKDHPTQPRNMTPLGALDEVYNWMVLNEHKVLHPMTKQLMPPWDGVTRVLRREIPRKTYEILGQPGPGMGLPKATGFPTAPPKPFITGTTMTEDDIPF